MIVNNATEKLSLFELSEKEENTGSRRRRRGKQLAQE